MPPITDAVFRLTNRQALHTSLLYFFPQLVSSQRELYYIFIYLSMLFWDNSLANAISSLVKLRHSSHPLAHAIAMNAVKIAIIAIINPLLFIKTPLRC